MLAGAGVASSLALFAAAVGARPSGQLDGLFSAADKAVSEAAEHLRIASLVQSLSLEQKVAQLFVIRPEALVGTGPVISVDDALRDALLGCPVGGLVLFDDNVQDPEQVRSLNADLQSLSNEACGLPLFVCVDEEGGTVTRVSDKAAFGVEKPQDMSALAAEHGVDFAKQEGERIGSYLADLGFNLDFAPDADVCDDPDNFIYLRSFGGDPEVVGSYVSAMVSGFRASGTLCCVKHFPGIGHADGDSHTEDIFINKKLEELMGCELLPFKAAVEAGVDLVMVGHGVYSELDSSPASLSRVIVSNILRGDLSYGGLVITDALEMASVSDHFSSSEVGVRALDAGCDLILTPVQFLAAFNGVVDAVREGRLSEKRIDESVTRVVRAKLRLMAGQA